MSPTAGGLWHEHVARDYGFAVGLHSATSSLARVDVAKGPEGVRLRVSLTAALGSGRHVIPYVP